MSQLVQQQQFAMTPLADLERMADAIAKSGLFGVKDPKQALALMLVAQAEGQHPATIAQEYDIIKGKASRKTHSVLARFQGAGGKVEWHRLDDGGAKATFSHPAGGSVTIDWDMERAKRTMVYEGDSKVPLASRPMYKDGYPRAMFRARCIAEGVRAVYPAALGGYLVPEEAQDSDEPEKVVTGVVVDMPQSRSAPQEAKSAPAASSTSAPLPLGDTTSGAAPDAATNGVTAQPMKPSQVNIIRAKLKNAALNKLDLEAAFPTKALEPKGGRELFTFADFDTVVDWIGKNAKG